MKIVIKLSECLCARGYLTSRKLLSFQNTGPYGRLEIISKVVRASQIPTPTIN